MTKATLWNDMIDGYRPNVGGRLQRKRRLRKKKVKYELRRMTAVASRIAGFKISGAPEIEWKLR